MTQLGDVAVARELRRIAEQRARQVAAGLALRRVWGVVMEVQDPDITGRGGTATLLLGGSATESAGVRWFQTRPTVGDTALVELPPPGGTRFIVALDRETTAANGAPVTLDLETLDTLGLATDSELDAHQNNIGHFFPYYTHNTTTADQNKWSMVSRGIIQERYGQISGSFQIEGGGADTAIWPRGTVRFRLKQVADFGANPVAKIELTDGADIAAADIALVITSNAGPTTYEIHLRITAANTYIAFWPRSLIPWSVAPGILLNTGQESYWNPCPDFGTTALPTGASFTA